MKVSTMLKAVIISTLFPLTATAQSFCTPKTDYAPDISCSGREFYADTPEDLASYSQNYALEEGKYKPLRIRFALTGEAAQLSSPCKISFKSGLTHTADNICIDGRRGVVIGGRSIFKSSGNITVVASKGDVDVRGSSFLEAQNLTFTSAERLLLSKGARAEVSGHMKLDSSFVDDRMVSTRVARDAIIRAGSFELTAKGKVNISHRASIEATEGNLTIATPGMGIPHRVTLFKGAALTASGDISIDGGNLVSMMKGARVEAIGNLSIDAKGCRLAAVTLAGATKSGTCTATGEGFNRHPSAQMDATPATGEAPLSVTLDASRSRDLDGAINSYRWTFSDGSTLSGVRATKTFANPGVETIALTVTDDDGSQAQKKGIVTVVSPAASPTANFTYHPIEGDTPLTVSLDASSSTDPDGTIVKYEWIFGDGMVLEGVMQTRTFDTAGTYTVALKVTDNDGNTHQTGESSIVVTESNTPPMMVGDQGFEANQNQRIVITLKGATDEEEDILTYTVTNPPTSGTLSGCLEGTGDIVCTYTPAEDFFGEAIFSYRANDGKQDSPMVSVVTLTIIPSDSAPTADAGSDQSAIFGDPVMLDGSASRDPERQRLSYSWEIVSRPMLSDISLANANTAKPEFIADRDGTYTFRLTVSDREHVSLPDDVTVTVTGEINTAPTLNTITSPQSVQVGQELRFTISGEDADSHDDLVFVARKLPDGARFLGPSRQFRFQPEPEQVGNHVITIIVTDGKESSTQDVTVTVNPPDPAQPTTLSSRVLDGTAMEKGQTVPLAGVKVSVEGSNKVATSDDQGNFTLTDIPAGALIVSLDASAVTASDGSIYGDFKGRLKIMKNVHNRPFRDYMLPKIDPKGMAMVEVGQGNHG